MTDTSKYAPFDADGRTRQIPPVRSSVLPGTVPANPTTAMCRMFIDRFMTGEPSTHSGQGGTLWVLLEYAQRNEIPYVLTARPGEGYQIRRLRQLCCNENCDWTGFTDRTVGSVGPLCPVCDEVTCYDYPEFSSDSRKHAT